MAGRREGCPARPKAREDIVTGITCFAYKSNWEPTCPMHERHEFATGGVIHAMLWVALASESSELGFEIDKVVTPSGQPSQR
jgi:hypothetical protein